jgi:glycosyltransferase involved in cell wall biosynthesis
VEAVTGRTAVLYVDHVSLLSGGERSLMDLVRAIDREAFSPHLACPGAGPLPDAFRALGLPVHPLDVDAALLKVSRGALGAVPLRALRWIPATLRAAAQVVAAARASGARLISSNSLKAHVIASLAAWWARIPLVWHLRDILPPTPVARALGWLAQRTAARVIVISDAVAHSLVAAGTFPMQRVVRIYNGVDVVAPKDPGAVRSALRVPEGALLAGTVGQIARWKGIDVLLEAVRERPHVHVAVTGGCLFDSNEAAHFEELKARAARPDLAGRVTFLGARDDVPDVMASLDVLVHPSVEPEPFGRVLVEAMAAGLPVVASNTGAAAEVLGDCGLLVRPRDSEAIGTALDGLARSPGLRERLGDMGFQRARAQFSPEVCRAQVERVYREVLA